MVRNVHERLVPADPEGVGGLLSRLAGDDDPVWPLQWPRLRLDRPLAVGARGGHGPVRYTVAAVDPGRSVVFRFDPSVGLEGTHRLDVLPREAGTLLRHTLAGRTVGAGRLAWPLVFRWLHDALVEDLLDRVEATVGPPPRTPARWSPWVRLLRAAAGDRRARPRPAAVPPELVAAAGLSAPDFADAFAVPIPAGASSDARAWHAALDGSVVPGWVRALMGVRGGLARALRLHTARPAAGAGLFPVVAASADTVVAGADDRHLDFRLVVHVRAAARGRELLLVTVVQRHNTVGRAYFALVRPFHVRVVPALMRRLTRRAVPGAPSPAGRPVPALG